MTTCALLAYGHNEGGLTGQIHIYRTCSDDTQNVECTSLPEKIQSPNDSFVS